MIKSIIFIIVWFIAMVFLIQAWGQWGFLVWMIAGICGYLAMTN